MSERFTASPSGVVIASDFRDNLIIDRYDPMFAGMRASKMKHLKSENSEDAVTWNVFRSLRQIDPQVWLPTLAGLGFNGLSLWAEDSLRVSLWQVIEPPPALIRLGDEGASEIDVVIETPFWVWFIEAKYHSDISTGTTTRPERNQVLRNLDVGSYYAGIRPFYFSLLIRTEQRSPQGVSAVQKYSDLSEPRRLLALHRPDGLANLKGVSILTWAMLSRVMSGAATSTARDDERGYAERACKWMAAKGLSEGS